MTSTSEHPLANFGDVGAVLLRTLENERISPSYLFEGTDPDSLREAAFAFAAGIVMGCPPAPTDPRVARIARNGDHPDVHRLTKDKAVPVLRQFVKDGGVLIAVGSQAIAAARLFEIPVRDGVMIADEKDGKMRRAGSKEFFIPGSLININIADNSMVTTGLSPKLASMFRRSPVFRVRDTDEVKVLARYPATGEVLASGWAIGANLLRGRAAAMEANIGSGRVYLFGPDIAYRGQPQGTIKLLFNAVLLGGANEVSTTELR